MSPQPSPAWMNNPPWSSVYPSRRRGGFNPDLRVSDAERADVADRLSKHYGEGRLDQAEFNDRMERAMSAKTMGDFAGLFSDLPEITEPGQQQSVPATRSSCRSPMSKILLLILIIVGAAILGHALMHSFFPWLLLGVALFLWLRYSPRRQHHHNHTNT
ncbi:MAG TPA: DUF1707 domain-containing protein [Streptosporangiaceae bacterium]